MPYDSVYSESARRAPCALRRKFYSDAPAMVGLYGCAGLALLCILAAGSRPMVSISNFWAISYCHPRSRYGEVSFSGD